MEEKYAGEHCLWYGVLYVVGAGGVLGNARIVFGKTGLLHAGLLVVTDLFLFVFRGIGSNFFSRLGFGCEAER